MITLTIDSPDESQHILKPKQKKLTNVEAQRLMNVAHQTDTKLRGTMSLPFVYDHLDRFTIAMGTELVAMIQKYHELCTEYISLYEKMIEYEMEPQSLEIRRSMTTSSLSKLDPIHLTPDNISEKFCQLQIKLRNSTKTLLRQIKQCPSYDIILNELQNVYPMRISHLLKSTDTMCDVLEEMLLTTHIEEMRRKEYLEVVTEQYEEAEKEIKILQNELDHARTLCDNEVMCNNY